MKDMTEFFNVMIPIVLAMLSIGGLSTLAAMTYEKLKYGGWPSPINVISRYLVPAVAVTTVITWSLIIALSAMAVWFSGQIGNFVQ